jgi:Holliday junction resolvasome RuvABC endonuclease subunit
MAELDRRLLTTGLCQTMQEIVSDYILIEDFFMSTNIKKALEQHQSDMAAQQVHSLHLSLL